MLPKENQLVLRRIRDLEPLAKKRAVGAARLVFTILHLWQRTNFPKLVRGRSKCDVALARNQSVIDFAAWLAKGNFFDSAFWLSSAYAAWAGDKARKKNAMYFTPPDISARLIDNLVSNKAQLTRDVWMDPACGGAAFLAPVASRMAQQLRSQNVKSKAILTHVATHLVGNDVDPDLARLSKQFLRMSLYKEIVEARFEPTFKIGSGDALTCLARYKGKIDVIICNPPYRKMVAREVEQHRRHYDDVIVGQPNVYALFFKLALDLLKQEGIAGLLTPTSFLSGQYFSPLRTFLLENAETLQLDIIHERVGVFVAAELDTAITILKKHAVLHSACAYKKTQVFVFDRKSGFADIGECKLPNSGTSWPIPRQKADVEIIRSVNGAAFHLANYGYQARVGAFVWNRDRRKTFLTQKAARNAPAAFPLIWSSDIGKNGMLRFGHSQEADGRHLYVNMRQRDHDSVVRRPCVVLQRVTSPDQPRRLVGAPVTKKLLHKFGGVVGENHVVFLEQINATAKLAPSQLAAVLRSNSVDRLFRCISGAVNVSIFELNQLPLPDPNVVKRLLKKKVPVDTAVSRAFEKKRVRIKQRKNA